MKKFFKKIYTYITNFFNSKLYYIVGYKEFVGISINGIFFKLSATIDTGNGTICSTIKVNDLTIDNNIATFKLHNINLSVKLHGESVAYVGNEVEHRHIILADYIQIGDKQINDVFICISDKRNKSTEMLINRGVLSNLNILVNSKKKFTLR